jgi:hypothetical protein
MPVPGDSSNDGGTEPAASDVNDVTGVSVTRLAKMTGQVRLDGEKIILFKPLSRLAPSKSLSTRRFNPVISSMNGNQGGLALVLASISGMLV